MHIFLFQKFQKFTCGNGYNVLDQYIVISLSFESKPNRAHTNIDMYFNILQIVLIENLIIWLYHNLFDGTSNGTCVYFSNIITILIQREYRINNI